MLQSREIVPQSDPRLKTTQVKKFNNSLRIGTLNLRCLNAIKTEEILEREIETLQQNIVGISEMKWKDEHYNIFNLIL